MYFAFRQNEPSPTPENVASISDRNGSTMPAPPPTVRVVPLQTVTPRILKNSPQLSAEIQGTIARWCDAILTKDIKTIDGLFDGPRALEEMRALGVLDDRSDAAYLHMCDGFKSICGGLLVLDPDMRLRNPVIRRIETLGDPNEFLIYSIASDSELKNQINFRWWVRRSESGWKIYDYQCLDGVILRSSRRFAFSVGQAGGNLPGWCAQFNQFSQVTATRKRTEDQTRVDSIDLMERSGLPAEYKAVLTAVKALITYKSDPAKAIVLFDRSLAQDPDNPGIFQYQALALARTGQFENAISAIKKHIDLMGDSAFVCAELGVCYEKLNRPIEAAEAFRRGLLCNPQSTDNRDGLSRVSR